MTDTSVSIGGTIGFGFLSWLLALYVKRRGFFRWSPSQWNPSIFLWNPLLFFGLYFAVSLFAIKFLAPWVLRLEIPSPLNFCLLTSSIPFLQLACFLIALFLFSEPMRERIWKDPSQPISLAHNFKTAFLAWLVAFPTLSFVGNLLELLLYYGFGIKQIPDQTAVLFVKKSLEEPFCFPVLFATIAIATPFVEELLFRGALQSFIRKHLGPKSAIWITAICFALFHYTPEQRAGNVVILGSLFPLALLLGFLYEKQRSLFAPILLHALFNGINLFALLIFGETPCGPI